MRTKSIQDVMLMYDEYKAGGILKDISKKYATDCGYLFRKYNLPRLTAGEKRMQIRSLNNEINYTFDKITNEIEAYIIGLYFADGTTTEGQVTIKLQKQDLEILKTIRDYIYPKQEIKEDEHSFIFKVSSIACVNNIRNFNVIKDRKQNNLLLPEVSNELFPHLLRGFFDGDGTVYFDKNLLRCNICSVSEIFLNVLNNKIIDLGFEEGVIRKESRVGKEYEFSTYISTAKFDMYRLTFNTSSKINSFYKLLYSNASIYLQVEELVQKTYVYQDQLIPY